MGAAHVDRCLSAVRWLEGCVPPFAGADADGVGYGYDEDLAVPDIASVGSLAYRVDQSVDVAVGDYDLDLYLGQHVHFVRLAAAAHMDDPLLHPAAGDVDDVQADHAGRGAGGEGGAGGGLGAASGTAIGPASTKT